LSMFTSVLCLMLVSALILLGSAATMNNVTASRVHFHNWATTHHDCFQIVLVCNCTAPHVGIRVDLGSATIWTMLQELALSLFTTVLRIVIVSALILNLLLTM
jgi:hypothetical protein